MLRWLSMALAVGLLLAAGPAYADHPTRGQATLTGLPGVEVAVTLDGPLRSNGVTAAAVRRAIAKRLQEAGVPTGAERHAARLHVRLDARKATREYLALAIALELRQHVRLERAPEQVISAVTWSNAAVAPLRDGEFGRVPARVADLVVRTFVRDFKAANRQGG